MNKAKTIISALNQVTRTINLADAPSNASSITIDEKGNVGVGTTNPTSTLHVVGEINVSGVSGSGKVVCVKSNGAFGVCSDQPGASGTCTCG